MDGNDIVLKGVNIADPEVIYRDRHRVSILDVVDRVFFNLGCKVVRIPVTPEDFYGYGYGFLHQQDLYYHRYLKPLVDYCVEVGLYAIIDMHYVDGEPLVDGNPSFGYLDKKSQAFEFWDYIAPKFKDYSNVIYDIYNEPVQPLPTDLWEGPYDWLIWKDEMAQPLVNRIRLHAPENLILVGGPNYCLEMAGAASHPVQDPVNDPPSIAYITHTYPGHDRGRRIADVLDPIVDHVPVFVSEWGFEQGADRVVHGTADEFGTELIEYVERHKLGWTAWVFDNVWTSRMVNAKWSLLGEVGPNTDDTEVNGRMGGVVKRHL
ncbi:glycoside hydrolase family 5 protein [Aeoliella mucimassa]|uniref:glycoside hydrolase family 5 protein n=1 Tax=Aeoliella mucimassa TaxID=2527972 RepID=UPI0018D33C8F|nr:cellulase family glycosylhydrolase [Aeoliella mucimassa]